MKIIHCGDLHIDSKIGYMQREKYQKLRESVISSFEKVIEYAEKNDVKAIIVAGDMFDTNTATFKTKRRILADIKSAKDIDFLYLSGNHDDKNVFKTESELPENLKFFGSEWTYYRYGNVNIAGIEISKINSSALYGSLKLNKDDLNIVVMHGQVVGYKNKGDAEIISVPKFEGKYVDYLALGHIHSYSEGKIDDRGKFVYSGCLHGRGFDETGDKGFVLIETEGNEIKNEFVSINPKRFYVKEYSIDGEDAFYAFRDKLVTDIKESVPMDSIVEIIFKGKRKESFLIDFDSVLSRLENYLFFTKIKDETKLKVEEKDYENDKTVVGEFVRLVMGSDLTEDEKSKVLQSGLTALRGE